MREKSKDLRDYKVSAKKAEKTLSFKAKKRIKDEIVQMIKETKKEKN